MASNDIAVNNEWEWMWKGASMIWFKVLACHFPETTEEPHQRN
jgi:hypothetical protein